MTGPNIASQELLFNQLLSHLKSQSDGVAVVLRSGDAPNLKTALKKIIREATNAKADFEEDIPTRTQQNASISLYHTP